MFSRGGSLLLLFVLTAALLVGIGTCSSDSNCIDGSSSINDRGNCRISATGVGSVFNVGCAGCHCVAADPTAEVKAVTAPRSDAAWSIGSTQTISYTYTPGVQYVYIALYKEVRYKSGNLGAVMIISALSIATGNYVWVVPDLEPTHGYYIIIYQRIGYQLIGAHTSSGRFEIIVEGAEPCPRGEINADTGRRPCTLCDTGTFWTSARQCTSCPADTTTMTHGAQSVEDCYVNATNPIYSFEHVPHHYIKGSNAAGVFLEEHEEMSVEACAQLCLDDAGCKSFDAGVVGPYMSQEGDCFLSYDNRATAETGAFRPINQLNYYEKKHTQSVLTEFSKTDDCYIIGHDNGGSFDSVHTPEACGQLCLNDPCCTSFEVGVYNTITALDCRLSYVTVDLVNAKKVVCGKEHMMHLYKKTPSVTFHFKGVLYSETIKTDRDKESFEAFVKAAFETAGVSGTVESAAITTSPIDTIDCTVTFETLQGKQEAQSVLGGDGGLVFWWPIAIEGFGVKYVGSFRGADGGAESGRQRFRRQIGGLSGASMMKCTLECAANHDVLDPMASADCMAACTKKVDDNEDNDDADASPTIDTATTTATATTLAMTTGQDYQAGDDGDDGIWFDDDVVTPPPCNAGQRDDPTCGGSSGMYQRNECHIDYVVNLCPVMCRACTYIPSFDDRIRQGPCDPGTVSQTGSHPLCHTCRANTFSSPASTQCKPCPGGTTSIPGASSVSECIQTVIGDSPALFSVGDNWVGTYSLDHGSLDLSAWQILPSLSGALHLSVTAIIGNRLQFLLGVYHGEACNPPCSTARDEQLSEFYVTGVPSGAVMNLAVDLTGPHGGWAGITDRNFARAGLFGVVEKDVTTGGSYSFSGIFGDGAFKVSRACSTHRQGEADVLVPGDTFVGWSHCNRNQNQDGTDAVDGEKDVRRLQMKVSNYYASAGTVTGTVLFEDEQGRPFEYGVAGDFSPLSGCRSLSLSPTNQSAWKTRPPFGTRSRQLSGRLSDDGITFTGEWNANAECACLGASPTGAEGSGAACGYHGKSDMWCFVGPNCPEGVNKMNGPSGWYTAPCAPMPACPRFTMTRVCSATKSCPHGWEMFANNCYKAFDDVSEYQDAQATCESFNATLSSIASVEEATFLLQKAAQRRFSASHGAGAGAGAGAGDAQASQPMFNATSLTLPTIWIGLMTNATQAAAVISAGGTHENTWADGTLVGSDLDTVTVVSSSGSRRNPVNCGVLGVREGSVASGLIVTLGRCQAEVRFVCKREHLAVDTSSDAENNDGTSGLSPTTTSTPDLNTPNCHDADNGTYYDKNTGTCATCTSVTDCDEAETLVGTCSNTQTPRCVACYETCKSCSAPGSTACTMCVKSWYMSLEQPGLCVQECEFGQVKADKPRRCTACHPTCETCTGSSEDECESCLGSLYLLPSIFNTSEVSANDSDDKGYKGVLSVGTCFGECPEGMFKSRGTQTCVACSKCHFNQYQRRLCSGFQDTLCRDTTRCMFAPPKGDGTPASYSEYESKAPTFISDRECTDVTKCMKGEEQVTAPTHVSDSICQACKPGHVDDDRNGKTPCTKCLPGTFTSAAYGFIGKNACKKCPSGTVDDDSDPTTPCTSCSLASGQFVEEKGGTECSNVTSCDIGYEPINAARVDENVRCARCTDGFHKPVAGNTACTATPWCEPGYQPTRNATNIDDWGCRKCAAGTFKPTMGSERCKPFTVCNEGFQDFDASHDFVGSDRDQYCSPCLNSVTFSVLNGIRRSCMPVKECGLDEYENVPPTLSTDRECTARTLCNTNQYLSAAGSKTADSECAALATCRRNQWIVYQPDVLLVGDGRVANRICADCTVCNNTEQALSVCTKSTDTICSGCGKTCSPAYIANKGGTSIVNWGQFETSACGTDSGDGDIARKCQACTPCNYPKEYVRTLCTGADDTVCADSTACNFSDEFELSPPQGTEDRVCVPVTICGDGEGESVPPTETSDRECTLCVAGSSFIDVTSSPSTVKCKAVSACAAGFEESAAPTAVSDRQCTPCADGTFKGGSGGTACIAWPTCNTGEYETAPGTTLSKPECASCDGTSGYQDEPGSQQCKPIIDCIPGTYAWGEPSAYRNRECKPCPLGRYQPRTNAPVCLEKSTCGIGHHMVDYGNAETDTACSPCTKPNYKDVVGNDAECLAPTDCPMGHEEVLSSTAAADRVCKQCAKGKFSFGGAGPVKCQPLLKCGVGEFEAVAGSSLSDTICRPCPYGTFSKKANALQCRDWSRRCPPGTFESAPPNVSADRACDACPEGQFQDHEGQPQCIILTTCTYGEEETMAHTDKRDRICGQCTPGTFSADENDTRCSACADGQFQNRHGQSACIAWKPVCSDVFLVELAAPSTVADRTCSDRNDTALPAHASGNNETRDGSTGTGSARKGLSKAASAVIVLLVIIVVLATIAVVYYRRKFRAADPSGDFQVTQAAMVGDVAQAREFLNPMYTGSSKVNLQESARGGGGGGGASFTHFPAAPETNNDHATGVRRVALATALASPVGKPPPYLLDGSVTGSSDDILV